MLHTTGLDGVARTIAKCVHSNFKMVLDNGAMSCACKSAQKFSYFACSHTHQVPDANSPMNFEF